MNRKKYPARLSVLAALLIISLALLSCGSEKTSVPTPTANTAPSPTTATATPTPAPMHTAAPAADASPAVVGIQYTHRLYTHCGIRSANFDERRWIADPFLGDSNPPPGWGNPSDSGTMELISQDRALFISSHGEEAFFIPAPEDYEFKICI